MLGYSNSINKMVEKGRKVFLKNKEIQKSKELNKRKNYGRHVHYAISKPVIENFILLALNRILKLLTLHIYGFKY